MEALFAMLAGALVALGVSLMLRRDLFRVLLGISVLSNAVNLVVLTAGRLGPSRPPIVPEGSERLVEPHANPLPQALVLTAIVIGLGLVTFAAALLVKVRRSFGALELPQDAGDGDAEDGRSPESTTTT